MNKYLILDDGENIKSYSEQEKKYIVVGSLPVTKEMFELYGNDKVYNREGLVLQNPTLLYYTHSTEDFSYKLTGVPTPQILKLKERFPVPKNGIKQVLATCITSNLDCEIRFIFNNGTYCYGRDEEGYWVKVDEGNVDDYKKYGISNRNLSLLKTSDYNEIFSLNRSFSFSCCIFQKSSTDICKIQKVKVTYNE